MTTFMTATEARKNFFSVVNQANHPGSVVAITHEGIPKVVMVSFEEYEGLLETLEIMSDPETVADLNTAIREMHDGDVVDFEEVKKRVERLNAKEKRKRSKR
jgi:antitoxin YefM